MFTAIRWRSRLDPAARGDVFSRFHAEAGIAAEHCFAPSFRETRWKEIADLYAMLEGIAPSQLHLSASSPAPAATSVEMSSSRTLGFAPR